MLAFFIWLIQRRERTNDCVRRRRSLIECVCRYQLGRKPENPSQQPGPEKLYSVSCFAIFLINYITRLFLWQRSSIYQKLINKLVMCTQVDLPKKFYSVSCFVIFLIYYIMRLFLWQRSWIYQKLINKLVVCTQVSLLYKSVVFDFLSLHK